MNSTLQKAFSLAETLPEDQQESIGATILRLAKENQVDQNLATAESQGGSIPLNEVRTRFDRLKKEYVI